MKKIFSSTGIIGLVLVSGALLSGCTTNPNKPSDELTQRVAAAKTAADHASLASYYESEAAKSRKSAEQYRLSDQRWRNDTRIRVTNVDRYVAVIKKEDDNALAFDKLAAEQRAKACGLNPGSAACKPMPKN